MATNFKDALLEETPETTAPRGRGRAQTAAPEATPEVAPAAPAEAKPETPTVTTYTQDKTKIYHAIGLKDYATVIAGVPVYVNAGKPWQGTKFQYDTLKRAKLIQ